MRDDFKSGNGKNLRQFLILILIIAAVIPSSALDYYAFGDSITSGYPEVGYNNTYVFWINSSASAMHSTDGGGQTSTWGLEYIEAHYIPPIANFLIMFGTNDDINGVDPNMTAENLRQMYLYATSKGSNTIILISPLMGHDRYMNRNETLIESYLTNSKVPFIRTYDSIDTVPEDNIPENYNASYYQSDTVHPNISGHRAMGRYIWKNWAKNISIRPSPTTTIPPLPTTQNRDSIFKSGDMNSDIRKGIWSIYQRIILARL